MTHETNIHIRQGSDVTVSGEGRINIVIIRNDGSAFAGRQQVAAGSTVDDVMKQDRTTNTSVLVNGVPADASTPLNEGDTVSSMPDDIDGAR